jgi:hypothetical protein
MVATAPTGSTQAPRNLGTVNNTYPELVLGILGEPKPRC